MRAIRIHGFGGIDTMRLDEIPRPVPGAGEVPCVGWEADEQSRATGLGGPAKVR
jgi:hypothetical protein